MTESFAERPDHLYHRHTLFNTKKSFGPAAAPGLGIKGISVNKEAVQICLGLSAFVFLHIYFTLSQIVNTLTVSLVHHPPAI